MGRKPKFQTEEERLAHKRERMRLWLARNGRLKGTYSDRSGERSATAKLTEVQVREIRQLWREGWRYKQIAEKYDISPRYVWSVVSGINWRHLDDSLPNLFEQITATVFDFINRHGPIDEVKAQVLLKNIKKLLPKV